MTANPLRARFAVPMILLGLLALRSVAAVPSDDDGSGSAASTPSPVEPLRVAVSVPPLAWLVEALGGEQVNVTIALPPGASPATYDPSPRRLAEMADCRLFVGVGVPMEAAVVPALSRIVPQLEIVDAAAAADGLALDHDHGHHHGHAHNEPAPDPHIWLSPRRAPQLLEAIAAALIRARPELRPHIESVLPELLARFTALDREIASLLRGASRPVVVHHPSFGYLSADYGLETLVVERAGLSPTPAYLARVMDEITARGARGLVVQPQFADGQVRKAARVLGLEVVDLDPLARDLPANLRLMATRLGRLAGAGRSPR